MTNLGGWNHNNNNCSYLADFESLSQNVLSNDSNERQSAEIFLRRWVNSQKDPCDALVNIIKLSDQETAVMIAVVYCRSAALKLWGRNDEETQFNELTNNQTMIISKITQSEADASRAIIMQKMNTLAEQLINIVLTRWEGAGLPGCPSQQMGWVSVRNTIFEVISLLIKKGWAQSSSLDVFYPVVQQLLETTLAVLNGTSSLTHKSYICLRLFSELSRNISRSDTATLGITWDDYIEAKLLFIQSLDDQKIISLSQWLDSSNSVILEAGLEFMEIFVDWEFSITRSQTFLQTDIWFIPSSNWYELIFQLPSINSSKSSAVVFFDLLHQIHRVMRNLVAQSLTPVSTKLFQKSLYILTRACQFRTARLTNQILGGPKPPAEGKLLICQSIFNPLLSSLINELEGCLFVSNLSQLDKMGSGLNLAAEEFQSLTLSINKILDNPDSDVAELLKNESINTLVDIVKKSFLCLLSITKDDSDHAYILSIENLSQLLTILTNYGIQTMQQKQMIADWMLNLQQVSLAITRCFLKYHISVSSIRSSEFEDDINDEHIVGAGWNEELIIGPHFVVDFMKEMAMIGQYSALETLNVIIECLDKGSTNLEQDYLKGNAPTMESADYLMELLLYTSLFLVEPSDRKKDSKKPRTIPAIFCMQSGVEDKIIDIFSGMLEFLKKVIDSKTDVLPPSCIEQILCILSRFIDCYLLQENRYGTAAFTRFTSLDSGKVLLNQIVDILLNLLIKFSSELLICRLVVGCLLRASNWEHPTVAVLWDCPAFQYLIVEIKRSAVCPSESSLSNLSSKNFSALCRALTASTSHSEYIKEMVRAAHELQRTGTAVMSELSQTRLIKLLEHFAPIRDSLMSMGHSLQTRMQTGMQNLRHHLQHEMTSSQMTHMIRHLGLLIGFIRGIEDNQEHLYHWIQGIVVNVLPLVTMTSYFNEEVITAVLKVYYRCLQKFMRVIASDSLKELLMSIQNVIQSFIEHLNLNATEESQENEPKLKNISRIFKMLTSIMGESYTTERPCHLWAPEFVVTSVLSLQTGLGQHLTGQHHKLILSYLHLLFQLIELHPTMFLSQMNPNSIEIIFKFIKLGLFSESTHCQFASSEAIGACCRYLMDQQLASDMVSDQLDIPSQNLNLFSTTSQPESHLTIIERLIADIGIQTLIHSLAITNQKKVDLYADVIFDIFSLLSIKAYNLNSFFIQFSGIFSHEVPIEHKEMAKTSFLKAAKPLIMEFVSAAQEKYKSKKSGQSLSMSQIKYTQFRISFRQQFTKLRLACRLSPKSY